METLLLRNQSWKQLVQTRMEKSPLNTTKTNTNNNWYSVRLVAILFIPNLKRISLNVFFSSESSVSILFKYHVGSWEVSIRFSPTETQKLGHNYRWNWREKLEKKTTLRMANDNRYCEKILNILQMKNETFPRKKKLDGRSSRNNFFLVSWRLLSLENFYDSVSRHS